MADIDVGASGTTVEAAVDDQIVVRLPENASTGYQWSIESMTGPLRLVSSELASIGVPEGSPPGAASERFVRIACTAPGHGRARLELRRVWETEPLERFEFQVRID
jgi:inhibitor of cysteine peptidase